jgi:hypothetical protein
MTREQRLQKLNDKRAKLMARRKLQLERRESSKATERDLVLVTAQAMKLELKVAA